jgi:hypothetical protein
MYRSLGDVLERMGWLNEARQAFQKAEEVGKEVMADKEK